MEEEQHGRYVKTNAEGLIRDTQTQAILNTDIVALKNHRMQRERHKKTQAELNRINTLSNEVDSLKSDITEIKDLLKSLVSNTKE